MQITKSEWRHFAEETARPAFWRSGDPAGSYTRLEVINAGLLIAIREPDDKLDKSVPLSDP